MVVTSPAGAPDGPTGRAPKVSVILPNYNHAKYLPQRIESILGQTFTDFELLILDDMSPDDSLEVIARYTGDPRVRTAFNTVNSGSAYLQWRKGLAMVRGEYVWVAESDDMADLHFLERLVPFLDDHPRVGLAVANTMSIDEQDRPLREYFESWRLAGTSDYDLSVFDRDFVMDGRTYLRTLMVPWNTIPNASAMLFRRSVIEAIGGPELSMRLCGDWFTYARMLLISDIARVSAHLNFFREHQVNVRSSFRGERFAREALAVESFIAREVGISKASRRRSNTFYAQILVEEERDAQGRLHHVPAIVRRAASFGPAMLRTTLRILAREYGGKILRATGLRRR